jgi:hypothetical protein
MDDFTSGPRDFTVTMDTNDPRVPTQQHETDFTAFLSKPLEFSGEWEVALTQLIFKPEIDQIHPNFSTVEIKENSNSLITGFNLNAYRTDRLKTTSDLIEEFNASIPVKFKDKIFLSVNEDKLSLKSEDFKISFPEHLGRLYGFYSGAWMPFADRHTMDAPYKPNFTGHTEICRVFSDIIVPQIYGSTELPILRNFVLPKDSDQLFHLRIKDPSYLPLMRTYISFINIKIVDVNNQQLLLSDRRYPIILTLHFRKWKP